MPVALDNCGLPDLAGALIPDEAPVMALTDLPHLTLKVSSHLLLAVPAGQDPADLIEQLDRRFGSQRMIWCSDYPQTQRPAFATYADHVALAHRSARRLDAAARADFLGAVGRRLFRLEGAAPASSTW